MNFLLSPELVQFRDSLNGYFTKTFPPSTLRREVKASDEQAWRALSDLGVFIAAVPEKNEGLGLGIVATQIVLEESARVLAAVPLFESLVLGQMLVDALLDGKDAAECRTLFQSSDYRVTAAAQLLFADDTALKVTRKKGVSSLDGECSFVPSPELASVLLISAPKEKALFVVDLRSEVGKSVSFSPLSTLDLLRPFARVSLNRAPATRFAVADADRFADAARIVSLGAVSEMTGAADHVLQMTLEHVKTRKQFGRPIGSFQAIQHKLASAYLELEQVRSLARFSAWAYDHDRPQFSRTALSAKALAGETLPRLCHEALQAHGGIGFTFEHDLHLYLRRIKTSAMLFGTPAQSFDELARDVLFTET